MARIYLSPPDVGPRERERLLQAFDSGWIAPVGPDVDAFERELAACLARGEYHAVALSSGTAALHLALRLVGVGPGDQVLVSDLTFVASVNPIAYLGATPVLIDSVAGSWNLDPDLVAEELAACARRGKLPAAVVAVDIYGQCADHDRLRDACEEHGVVLIEDAAEALGASYRGRSAGTLGDIGVLSFNGNKIITTSSGGALLTRSQAFAERARHWATQARDPAPHYQHSQLGHNYRMSNLLAALGRAQLETLPGRVSRRRAINAWYRQALAGEPGIEFMPEADYGTPTCWLTCITVDPDAFGATREDIREALERCDIESRPVWKPMHLQPLYADCRVRGGAVSERLFETGLCLPSGSSLTDADLERIAAAIRAVPRRPRAARGAR
jgi:dTDP-4-amino-4,6-dideoxygalactose transaminase